MTRLIMAAVVIWVFSIPAVGSQPQLPENPVRGELWLKNDKNELSGSLLLKTDVSFEISGVIARAVVRQSFKNPSDQWLEGVYVFPLPENAAVDHLTMRIGERQIEGVIKERQEAKKVYLKARHSGKKASLVEQERPNIFTTSVANIDPGGVVQIEIEYQHRLEYRNHSVSMRFPLVVAPRYIPGVDAAMTESVSIKQGFGWARNTDQVPDASRITPPVRHPNAAGSNDVAISIHLKPGFEIEGIDSHFHAIDVLEESDGEYFVALKEGVVPANRDFVVTWNAKQGDAPQAAAFSEQRNDHQHTLLMVVPPSVTGRGEMQPLKEVVFVIDTSGSMYGESIGQAKKALRAGLRRLDARDTFNIIEFNSAARKLFPDSRRATVDSIEEGVDFIDALVAEGGTEMLPALKLALDADRDDIRLRQLVFLTDGAIGNEETLFSLIHDRLGQNRLYTVGIGSAPNSYFMRKVAQFGRGTFTYIGDVSEVEAKLTRLFSKIESPLLTDIQLSLAGTSVDTEIYPSKIPDLYDGEPLFITMRSATLPDKLVVTGLRGVFPWKTEIEIDINGDDAGVAALWARSKIEQLMDDRIAEPDVSQKSNIKDRIVDVALEHHLVTRFTSLVAVEINPSRQADQTLNRQSIETELPKNWNYEKVFGMAQTATPGHLHLLIGLSLFTLAWIPFLVRASA